MTENGELQLTATQKLYGAAVFALFFVLRIIGLFRTNELEDNDSIGFIVRAEMFRDFDWSAILDMEATVLPLYSVLIALLSFLVPDIEVAARLVSLLASAAATIAAALLAVRYSGYWAGIATVLLIAVNPYLIRFSYSIVSEPLYAALFGWTLYLFVRQLSDPTTKGWLILGCIGGLAFAARFESILLFTTLPLLFVAHVLVFGSKSDVRGNARSLLVYACVFTLLLAPQVWRVSEKMNSFGLNGRTVWQTLLNRPDGKSYDEKLYALDFDPATTNVYYLQTHPEELKRVASDLSFAYMLERFGKKTVLNVVTLCDTQLSRLVGLPILAFCILGFIALLRSRYAKEAVALVAIIGIGLAAPLTNRIVLDHIALIAWPITALGAMGLIEALSALKPTSLGSSVSQPAIALLLLAITLVPYLAGHYRLYGKPDDANRWYDANAISGAVTAMRSEADTDGHGNVLLAHSMYVPYFAGMYGERIPWTSFDGLTRYMRLNGISYVYINRHTTNYPFAEDFQSESWRRTFALVYAGTNDAEGAHAIFRLGDPAFVQDSMN